MESVEHANNNIVQSLFLLFNGLFLPFFQSAGYLCLKYGFAEVSTGYSDMSNTYRELWVYLKHNREIERNKGEQ